MTRLIGLLSTAVLELAFIVFNSYMCPVLPESHYNAINQVCALLILFQDEAKSLM